MRRLNAVLPPDVRVHGITRAAAGFDARFSALSRRYCYRIADRPSTHDPLTRGQVLWHRRELDIDLMADAAAHLLGEHDFAALCRPREGASTVRRVMDGIVQRTPAGVIEIWIEADAFCHSMIRFIAGALVAVGECRREPEWMADLLARRTRDPAAMVLPAHGLTLEAIRSPADADLAATAMAHRVLRGPAHLG
jgi:tRNA pseudouridine38-40 synthase